MRRSPPFNRGTSFMINDILRGQNQERLMQENEELKCLQNSHPLLWLARQQYCGNNLMSGNQLGLGFPPLEDSRRFRAKVYDYLDDAPPYLKNGLNFMGPKSRYVSSRATSDFLSGSCVFPPLIASSAMNPYLPLYLRSRFLNFADATSGYGARKCRRSRTVFSELQLMALEERFKQQKYLSTPDRMELAEGLGLTQLQVKTWYQNRRMKWKKQVQQKEETKQTTCDSTGNKEKLPTDQGHESGPCECEGNDMTPKNGVLNFANSHNFEKSLSKFPEAGSVQVRSSHSSGTPFGTHVLPESSNPRLHRSVTT